MRIFTGKPGSGKSYGAARYLFNTYLDWDEIGQYYDLRPGVELVSNIEGLRCPHRDFERELSAFRDSEQPDQAKSDRDAIAAYLSESVWQERAADSNRWVVVIDEAQRYFPARGAALDNSVWYFFEYHRHWGIDLILMTQDASSLNRRVLNIAETYVKGAPPGMRGSKNLLRYSTHDAESGHKVGMKVVKTDKRIFNVYQSAQTDDGNKPPRFGPIQAMLLLLVFLFGVGYYGFATLVDRVKGSERPVMVEPVHDKRPVESPVMQPGVHSQDPIDVQHAVLTVNDIQRFGAVGIDASDVARMPQSCDSRRGLLVCPGEAFPPRLAKVVESKICGPSGECQLVFRVHQ